MADAPYTRSFSFAGFQANRPATPLPGQRVDIELDNIARELTAIRALIAAGGSGGGGGPSLPSELLPLPARSLRANLLGTIAIPQTITLGQLANELGISPGGGELPDWDDVQNKPVFGNAALRNVGSTAGTVAAGDDPRIVGALQAASNGNDIPNKALFRSALGLGAAALLAVGTAAGTVAAGDDPRFSLTSQKTIKDYGAKMDGVTDDSAAWEAMRIAEGRVVVGPGDTRLDNPVGVLNSDKGVTYRGSGKRSTRVFMGANGRINVSGRGWVIDGFFFEAAAVVQCAIRTGTVANNQGWQLTNNFFWTESYNDITNAQNPAKYFNTVFEGNACWFGRAVNNDFFNWANGYEQTYGTCCFFRSSVNNYFGFNSVVNFGEGYVWSDQQSLPGINCEGHQIVGNVVVGCRRAFYFMAGIYAALSANCIDLNYGDGAIIESYIVNLILDSNWLANHPNKLGGVAILGGEAPVITNNTFRFNNNTNQNIVLLTIKNCNRGIVSGNEFYSGYVGMTSNGNTDGWIVGFNQFVSHGGIACNLSLCTNLTYALNNPGSFTEILPADYKGKPATSAASFAATTVFTTPSAASVQFFDVAVPSGIFSTKPIAVPTNGGGTGLGLEVWVDYDNCTATSIRVVFQRLDGGTIASGNSFRFNVIARAAG